MVSFRVFVILLALTACSTVSYGRISGISARMLNGVPADTMKRFPHYVTIIPYHNGFYQEEPNKICGGSILSKRWILTSLACVESANRIEVQFQKLYKNDTEGSFSFIVNNDRRSVHPYPTEFDDLAMIKCPFDIIFSDTIKSIEISSKSPVEMERKLAVIPGFDAKGNNLPSRRDQLTYGMLTVASNEVCKRAYVNEFFDEYLMMCAVSKSQVTPCLTESGSGLVVNWPTRPKLIGVLSSASKDCDASAPFAFTNLLKYQFWIDSMLIEDQTTTTTSTTETAT